MKHSACTGRDLPWTCRAQAVHACAAPAFPIGVFSLLLPAQRHQAQCAAGPGFCPITASTWCRSTTATTASATAPAFSDFVTQTMRAGGVNTGACELHVLCYPRILRLLLQPADHLLRRDRRRRHRRHAVRGIQHVRRTHSLSGHWRHHAQRHPGNRVVPRRFTSSPFNEADGEYGFRVTRPGERTYASG